MPNIPSSSEIGQLGQSLLVGLKRRALTLPVAIAAKRPDDETSAHPAIIALTLAGQHSRFQRITAPAPDALTYPDEPLHRDPRPMLSDASRRALKQLLEMFKGGGGYDFFNACLDEMARHGLRPHPFDLPELRSFLSNNAVRQHPAILPSLPDEDAVKEIGAEEWAQMQPDLRIALLRRWRATEPAAARERIETLFANESADRRAELLEILENRLGPDDLDFLGKAVKDRSGPVKDLAQYLLDHLPGATDYEERLSEAEAALSVKNGRKPQRQRKLVLDAKMITRRVRWQQHDTTRRALSGLLLGDLVRQLDLTEDDFFETLAGAEVQIVVTLARTAASRGDREHLEALLPHFTDQGAITRFANDTLHTPMPDDCRKMLADRFAAILTESSTTDEITLLAIYKLARAPLSQEQARDFLNSACWRDHVAELHKAEETESKKKTPNGLAAAALLMPAPFLDEFLSGIADLPMHLAGIARAVVTFRQSLASTVPVPPIAQSQAKDGK